MVADAKRTTYVEIKADVGNYLAGLSLADKQTSKFANSQIGMAQRQKVAAKEVGTAFLGVGAIAAVAVGGAIYEFAKFDAKMAQLQALSHATTAEMAQLSQAALTVGQKYGFTATEVADAQIELVKAGVSVKDILGGALTGALTLAAAGQIDVAQSTEIATIAMTQFGLKGKDIPHVADLLAAGADKALGSVEDLGEALKSGGLISSQFGVSLDDTVGTLSAFANAGLIGETAGTDLRQMLLKLANPSATAASTMKQYGIEVYNAAGKFVGFDGLAGELQSRLGKLSESQRNSALATIFGARAIAGANVLYSQGAKGIDAWNKKVEDQGFGAQQASGKLNNLQGDLTKLNAAFQSDLIQSGSGANSTLRGLTQGATGLISVFGQLPAPVLQGGLAIGTVVSATSLLTGGFFKAIPAIKAARATLDDLKISSKTAAFGIGGVAAAVAIVTTVLGLVGQAEANAAAATSEFADTLDSATHSATKASRAAAETALGTKGNFFGFSVDSTYDAAKKLGLSLSTVTDAALGQKSALAELNPIMTASTATTADNANAAAKLGLSTTDYIAALTAVQQGIRGQSGGLRDAITAAKQSAEANKGLGSSTKDATAAFQSETDAVGLTTTSVKELGSELESFAKPELDARDAIIAFHQALSDTDTALKKNGATLDLGTEKGRDNASALDKLASSTNDAASKAALQGDSVKRVNQILADGKQKYDDFIAKVKAAGGAIGGFSDDVIATPNQVQVEVKLLKLQQAQAELAAFKASLGKIGDLESNALIKAQELAQSGGNHTPGGGVLKKADGGYVTDGAIGHFAAGGYGFVSGPGTSTSDSIFARLSNGEYVIKASAVRHLGLGVMEQINQGVLPNLASIAHQQTTPNVYVSLEAPSGSEGDRNKRPVNQQVTFVNPVVRDLYSDTAKASQMLAANMSTLI